MHQTAVVRAINTDRDTNSGKSASANQGDAAIRPPYVGRSSQLDYESHLFQSASQVLSRVSYPHTHVGTDVFAEMLFVEAKTVLKSHSLHAHYAGIRPVRLPNRKLAWPIAEIESLFERPNQMTAKEVA